ncbi:MAG TPA: tyrosine-type recombinase/integrase [Thermosynergistes sp.]|nr:tyrosine-type recombinase/integrase [Thermosynergistes sp.]
MEALAVRQVESDRQVVAMWLHEKSKNTQDAYIQDIKKFLDFTNKKPFREVTIGDIQAFSDSLASYAPATKARALAAVKSLFAFAHRIGYLRYDVSAPIKLPKIKETLGERILSETDVQRLIGMESKKRNKVLLNLIYIAGLRVSEACSLKWRDIQPAISGGYITVFGKGDKTRTILIGKRMYEELLSLKGEGGQDDPVFVSQKYGPLSLSQAWRIVKAAAKRAGINPGASPHWLRHAHASHALERGCPIHLVQATLGHASVATTGRYLHARPNDSSALYLAQ